MVKRVGVIAAAIVGLAGCLSGEGDGSAVVERRTVGDTTIVRTVSGSVWGDTALLVEELRIGALDGRPELEFAWVYGLAVGADGSMHVHEGQTGAVRTFDSSGAFIRAIGRPGDGPGEYGGVRALRALPDGRVAILDSRAVNVYSPTGVWIRSIRLAFPDVPSAGIPLAVDTAGDLHALTRGFARPTEPNAGALASRRVDVFVRIDSSGSIPDTLALPTFSAPEWTAAVFAPEGSWTFHPHGHFVVGRSDQYAFEMRYRDGRVLRVERVTDRVSVEAGEKASLKQFLSTHNVLFAGPDGAVEMTGGAPIADVKPVYRKLAAAEDGRIWVQRHTTARRIESAPDPSTPNAPTEDWVEPQVHDVFEPDGRYLGAVAVPDGATLHVMAGDRVWGTVFGDSGEQYVVRWRVVRAGGASR
jgi:hypothetical protein